LWRDRQSGAHLFSHDAKAPDGLIVTPDGQFFKTAGLESPMPLGSGTRQRPPQSGFVQVGIQVVIPKAERTANE